MLDELVLVLSFPIVSAINIKAIWEYGVYVLFTKEQKESIFPLFLFLQDKQKIVTEKRQNQIPRFNLQTCCTIINSMSSVCTVRYITRDTFFRTRRPCFWNPVQIFGGCCGDLGCWNHLSAQFRVWSITKYLFSRNSKHDIIIYRQLTDTFIQKGWYTLQN